MDLFVDSIQTNFCWPISEHPSKTRGRNAETCQVDLVLRDSNAAQSYYLSFERFGAKGERFMAIQGKGFTELSEEWKTPHRQIQQAIYLQSLIRGPELGVELANQENVDEFFTDLTTFLAFGSVEQPDALRFNGVLNRRLLEAGFAIRAKYPQWWTAIRAFLATLSRDSNLGSEEQGRLQWLLDAEAALEIFETAVAPAARSDALAKGLRAFVAHLMVPAPVGEDFALDPLIQNAAAEHFASLSGGFSLGDRPDWFAHLLAATEGAVAELKSFQGNLVLLARRYQVKNRLYQAVRERHAYLLSKQNVEDAFRQGLLIKYTRSPAEHEVLSLVTRHLTVRSEAASGKPLLHLDMEKIFADLLRDFAKPDLTPALRREKLRYLSEVVLGQLLVQGKTMEVFWHRRFQEMVNFYPILAVSGERRAWSNLIEWTRRQIQSERLPIATPHVLWNKSGFFFADLPLVGLGAVGGLIATQARALREPSLIVGGTGIGGGLGNLACYLLDISNRYYQCDLIGGALGAALTATALYAVGSGSEVPAPPPQPPPTTEPNPERRFPIDPYGH